MHKNNKFSYYQKAKREQQQQLCN